MADISSYIFLIILFSHPERTAGARHVIEAPPEALGHDGVQDRVEDGVKVVEHTGHHEEHVLGLITESSMTQTKCLKKE